MYLLTLLVHTGHALVPRCFGRWKQSDVRYSYTLHLCFSVNFSVSEEVTVFDGYSMRFRQCSIGHIPIGLVVCPVIAACSYPNERHSLRIPSRAPWIPPSYIGKKCRDCSVLNSR
ncbi:hypothetical protein BKA93DRAFT_762202 [Sparassis latifolia]